MAIGLLENKKLRFTVMLLSFVRLRNCFMTFFGVIVGASLVYAGSHIIPFTAPVLTAAVAAALITAGGNTLNDYFDIETDKVNKPHRPIPAGRITKSDALMFSVTLFLIGLALAKAVNKYTLLFAGVNTIILVLYARYSKKMFFISNLSISYLVASIFVYGALAIQNPHAPINPSRMDLALILAACAFFMTFSREVMKDVEDLEGDQRMYSRTLPIVLGQKKAKRITTLFALAAIALSLMPLIVNHPGLAGTVYGPLIVIADLLFLSALTMYAPLGQRTMLAGMSLALIAFLTANILTRV